MIKNYTDKDYADKAVEANSKGLSLYILVTPTEFTDEDEQGNPFTYTEDVATLVLAETGYYVTYNGNYTDGTINENLEQEKINKRKEDFNNNFVITSWGAFRKTPKGYSSAVEAVNTIFNMVNVQQAFTEQLAPLLIFYEVPDFTKAEECTEEWLVANQKTHEPCDLLTFMQWYLEFQTVWASTQYTDIPVPQIKNDEEI